MPIEPARAAARSDKMSACKLVATIVSSEFGFQRHAHGHRIYQHLVPGDVGKFSGNLQCYLIPQNHAVALGIGFGNNGQMPAVTRPGHGEGKPHDACNRMTGEYGNFACYFLGLAPVRASAMACIFPFRIFTDDHPVQITGANIGKGTGDPR